MKPIVHAHIPGALEKTCARCHLDHDDDGYRVKRHGGKVFLCVRCRGGGK